MRRILLLPILAAGITSCAVLGNLGSGPDRSPLRIATYNIRHGVGMGGQLMLERTATTLRRLDADIVGLEEVDQEVARSGGVDQARMLGDLLGMEHAFGSFMAYGGGHYGLALLSRYPIVSAESIELPPGTQEPRVALHATVVLPGDDTVSVVVVHFDWLDQDDARFRQAATLTGRLAGLTRPWIVLGDFNDQPESRTLKLFQGMVVPVQKRSDASLTFPADRPVREIDFVFGSRDDWRVDWTQAIPDSVASDHRPVVAVMRRTR